MTVFKTPIISLLMTLYVEKRLRSVTLLPLGYRENELLASLAKVGRQKDKLFIHAINPWYDFGTIISKITGKAA